MTQKRSKPVVAHMDIRKLKPEPKTNLPSLSKAKLEALIEEAIVDAYGEEEQKVGLLTHVAGASCAAFFGEHLRRGGHSGEGGYDPRWSGCGGLPARRSQAED
jgi:hypothetical protein